MVDKWIVDRWLNGGVWMVMMGSWVELQKVVTGWMMDE